MNEADKDKLRIADVYTLQDDPCRTVRMLKDDGGWVQIEAMSRHSLVDVWDKIKIIRLSPDVVKKLRQCLEDCQ